MYLKGVLTGQLFTVSRDWLAQVKLVSPRSARLDVKASEYREQTCFIQKALTQIQFTRLVKRFTW